MSKVTLSVTCGSTVLCGFWTKEREDFEAHGQGRVQSYSKELTCSVTEEFSWVLSHCLHASGSEDGILGQDMGSKREVILTIQRNNPVYLGLSV